MKQICFMLKLKKDKLDEYLKNHQVWPEMLDVLSHSEIKNYSLFVDIKSASVIGYFESENPEQSLKEVNQTEVNKKWQEKMSEYFEMGSGDMRGGAIQYFEQYFYLK